MPDSSHVPVAVKPDDGPAMVHDLAKRLRTARRVLVLTGAGISAESGIPTFRDAQTGLWARYRAEDLATPEAFQRDPALVWRWYAWRRERVLAAQPNAGHVALVELAARVPSLTLVTQNVDGLHQRAGSRNVIELHGSIHHLHRVDGDRQHDRCDWPDPAGDEPPRGSDGVLLRPSVVWFGENLPESALAQATAAAEQADVVLSIGTSALVYPAAELPLLAQRAGAFVVEVNPSPTPLSSRFDLCLCGPAGTVLPQIVAALA